MSFARLRTRRVKKSEENVFLRTRNQRSHALGFEILSGAQSRNA
jgi:hypothetical protein